MKINFNIFVFVFMTIENCFLSKNYKNKFLFSLFNVFNKRQSKRNKNVIKLKIMIKQLLLNDEHVFFFAIKTFLKTLL